ncbi:HsdM family class I SAM-dependent methyltransferase, partial [Sulfuricurvum sp.]|uniref:HsdM family class I SAM-dependent methyltransferase n=1 Tax=Sulfuricurvum sp. TaxID=2025608 RepID=UPI003BB64570
MKKSIDQFLELPTDTTLQPYLDSSIVNILPQRIRRSLQEINPTSLYILNNRPVILFFDKAVDKNNVFKKCWNFGEAPIIIIETETDFEVYNGFEYILKNGNFTLTSLNSEKLNYLSIISGKYFAESTFKQNNNRVDKKLLENIKYAREELLNNGLNDYKDIANSLVGRIIFVRYLIDRHVELSFQGISKILTNEDLKEILSDKNKTYELFQYLKSDQGFNGDWFPINDLEYTLVSEEHLKILKELVSGTEIRTGQQSLFDYYDFSIIPIEFISNVYESFIGEEEQKKNGAYYTPTFLVDYILKYTVDEYFKNNPTEYNCKVLDPACGSGIFLVEAFRKLVTQFEKVTGRRIEQQEIVKIAEDNIFGIDKDKNAVQISVFSLYLTMLDYQNPKDIEQFKFPYLLKSEKNPNANFFQSDFFDTNAECNQILKDKKLDFIIGNPPYGRGTIKKKSLADKYVVSNKLKVGNQDIVQPFMYRVKDFVSQSTKISFIVTSKVLYNLQSNTFRTKHFFNQFKINHILELSSVRHEIFENADVPVSILFYEYSTQEEVLKNTINYISMKPNPYFKKLKMLTLAKSDFKKILQSKLLEDDYLWKILVYGSYLDFNLIKRLKKYPSINEYAIEKNYPIGRGISASKGKYNISQYLGKDFIDVSNNSNMDSFYVAKTLPRWNIEKVHRQGENKLFNPYTVLIRRGVNTKDLKAKSAVLYKEAIFKHALSGINTSNIDEAKNFVGLINSNLFAYFNLETATSLGVEREQLHDEEKLRMPFMNNQKIVSLVSDIEKLKTEHFDTSSSNILNYEQNLKMLINQLDQIVLESFDLTEQEIALVDYANSIVIPWVIQKKYDVAFKKLAYKDNIIEGYINIFIDHYSKIYEQNDMYFKAEVFQ